MSQRNQLLHALKDGPGTSGELAAETAIPLRQCSAVLYRIWRAGKVQRSPARVARPRGPGAYLYAAPTHNWNVWTAPEVGRLRSLAGCTPREAAKALGRSVPAVKSQAAYLGIALRPQQRQTRWPQAVKNRARRMRAGGMSLGAIAARLSVNVTNVWKWTA